MRNSRCPESNTAHFRVRWDEEHISLFYPAERGFVVRPHAAGETQPHDTEARAKAE